MMKVTHKVKVISGCQPDSIPSEVFCSKEPLLLKGLVKDWPLTKAGVQSDQHAIDYLKSFYSGKPAPVYFGASGTHGRLAYNPDVLELNFKTHRVPIDGVLDEILATLDAASPPVRYIASNIIDIFFPGLRADNDLQFKGECFDQRPLELGDPLAGIWIGNSTIAPCHYDAQSNIACCVVGKRRFTVFPPEQIHNLYPGPIDLTPGGPAITMVDFSNPDLEKYPRFEHAVSAGQVAEMEPGDALYLPCMWWHQVEALSPFNVLVNYWWNTFPKVMGQAVNALNHAILSIRDRPKEEKEAWKNIFDYYVFGESEQAAAHLPEASRGPLGPIDSIQARQLRAQLINKLNR